MLMHAAYESEGDVTMRLPLMAATLRARCDGRWFRCAVKATHGCLSVLDCVDSCVTFTAVNPGHSPSVHNIRVAKL